METEIVRRGPDIHKDEIGIFTGSQGDDRLGAHPNANTRTYDLSGAGSG